MIQGGDGPIWSQLEVLAKGCSRGGNGGRMEGVCQGWIFLSFSWLLWSWKQSKILSKINAGGTSECRCWLSHFSLLERFNQDVSQRKGTFHLLLLICPFYQCKFILTQVHTGLSKYSSRYQYVSLNENRCCWMTVTLSVGTSRWRTPSSTWSPSSATPS